MKTTVTPASLTKGSAVTNHKLVAIGYNAACMVAEFDWKWKPHSRGWLNHDNDVVEYVADIQHLRGLPRGTVIYLGPGWYKNDRLRDFRAIVDYSGYITKSVDMHGRIGEVVTA
jgi:hypothetical protein